jgi:site-specific recombinase XerD
MEAIAGGVGVALMSTTLKAAVESYLRARTMSRSTRNEYFSTLRKWERWGDGPPLEQLQHKQIREFLDWVHERAFAQDGMNPGRTANKAREHLRAVISWAWEQELIDTLPRFPKPREQRDVAGRHYLTKAEINALYFATHQMKRPRGWDSPSLWDGIGGPRSSSSSTTGSIPEPSGSPPPSTNRFCGGM